MEEQNNTLYIPQECNVVYATGGNDWGLTCAYLEHEKPVAAVIYLPDRSTTVCTSIGGGTWINGNRVKSAINYFTRQIDPVDRD